MGQVHYSVISVGGNENAQASLSARQFLSKVKGMTPSQVEAVLEGVPTIIKQGIDADTAKALAETMESIGLKCNVVEQNASPSLKVVDSVARDSTQGQPRAASPASQSPQQYRREDIVGGFHEEVERLELSLFDKIKMTSLAICMLMLPIAFVMFVIGLMASAVALSESAFAAWMLQGASFPIMKWVGAFLILGFTSVLMHRAIGDWQRDKKYIPLDRDRHPQLYTFVEKISTLVGVKAPVSIKLDAQVGVLLKPKEFFSPISGYRSELIIGLPLFYSLNVRQLAGVITHAFSGYSEDACHYGYPVVSSINGWLYRCSNYQLDTKTLTFSKRRYVINPVSYVILWPFDMLARCYFKLLHFIASTLSFGMSRKMDMQADIQSAQISGSNEFRSTQFRLRALCYGQLHAESENNKRMEKGNNVVPNYSAFIVDYADALRIELKPTLINEMEQLVTPLTRSRVVDLGRIVNVENHQFEGGCFLLGPAIGLLTDVEKLSREVTEKHYTSIGYVPEKAQLDDKKLEAAAAQKVFESLDYTFLGWQKSGRYLRFDEFHSHEDLGKQAKCQDLRDLVSKLSATGNQLTEMAERYCQVVERVNQLHVSKTLQEAGVDSSNRRLIDTNSDLRETEAVWLKALSQQGVLRGDLTYYEALISQRISLALSLAKQTPELKDALQVSDFVEYIDYLKDSVAFMYKAYESSARLRTYTYTLGALVNAGQLDSVDNLQSYFDRYHNYCRVELGSILSVLAAVAYPLALPPGMTDCLEQPSIAEVLRYSVKGIDQEEMSVSLCFKVCHSTLKFLDAFTQELMAEIDRIVYEAEKHYNINHLV